MGRPASQQPLLVSLEQSNLGAAMRESMWLYPAVEILHIFGFILLVGSIIGFDLRLLGLHRFLPVPAFAAAPTILRSCREQTFGGGRREVSF